MKNIFNKTKTTKPQTLDEFRKEAEKHFGGPVFLVTDNGEAIAYPVGKQAVQPNVSGKLTRDAQGRFSREAVQTAAVNKSTATAPQNAPHYDNPAGFHDFPETMLERKKRLTRAYLYDLKNGTRTYAILREYLAREDEYRMLRLLGINVERNYQEVVY